MRNHFCYSSGNEEYEESNISFPGEWGSRISQNPRGWGSSSSSLGSLTISSILVIMAVRGSEFSNEVYKIRKIFTFYQKMSITKYVLLNWYSSMKKKLRKIPMTFEIENWLWKLKFGAFWHLLITPILKIQWFSMGVDC